MSFIFNKKLFHSMHHLKLKLSSCRHSIESIHPHSVKVFQRFVSTEFHPNPPTPNIPTTGTSTSSYNPSNTPSNSIADKQSTMYELAQLKSRLGEHYANGRFEEALEVSMEMKDKVLHNPEIGPKTILYASCLNNVALMQKSLGKYEEASQMYITSLQLYRELHKTTKHSHYSLALFNLGIVYKLQAENSQGIQKVETLDQAETALRESLSICEELNGKNHKESFYCLLQLGGVLRIQKNFQEAENILSDALARAKQTFGDNNLLVANLMNSLGLVLKYSYKYEEAHVFYQEALKIRKNHLGKNHHEVIVTMHNIAELFLQQGKEEDATKIQNEILEIMETSKQSSDSDLNVEINYHKHKGE